MFHRYASADFVSSFCGMARHCTEQRPKNGSACQILLFSSPFPAASSLLFSLCSFALFALFALSGVGVDIARSRHSPYSSTLIHSFSLVFPFFSSSSVTCPVFRCQPSKAKKKETTGFFWPFFPSYSFLIILSLAWLNFFCLTCP